MKAAGEIPVSLVAESVSEEAGALSADLDALTSEVQIRYLEAVEQIKEENRIVDVIELSVEDHDEGSLAYYGYKTAIGHKYAGSVGLAKEPKTNIPVMSKAPWWVSLKGLMAHAGLKYMEAGFNYIGSGAAGSFHPDFLEWPNAPIDLIGAAAAFSAYSNNMSELYGYLIADNERTLRGVSQGSMTNNGILALEKAYDHNILYAESVAGCCPEELTIRHWPSLIRQGRHELASLARFPLGHSIRRLWHLRETLDFTPTAILHHVASRPALTSGEAGELALLVDPSKLVYETFMGLDYASMPWEWKRLRANNPNVRMEIIKGKSHVDSVRPRILYSGIARNAACIRAYEQNGFVTAEDIFGPDPAADEKMAA